MSSVSVLGRRAFLRGAAACAILGGHAHAQSARPDPLAKRFGGPFALTEHTGKRVTDRDYLGRHLIIYFGFTRCADACPVDIPNIAAALDKVAPLDARIQPLFVTVDPEDTPERMQAFVGTFHPRLVGLTGSEAELSAVAKAYRVHRYRVQRQAATGGPRHMAFAPQTLTEVHGDKPHSPGQSFTIDHGTLTYLMGPDGHFLTLIPRGASSDRIAEVIRTYVKG
jgi:protein SCO1